MSNQDQNRFNMVVAVQRYMDNSTATWTRVPVITRYKNELDTLVVQIDEQTSAGQADSKPLTRDKNQLKEAIALKASILAGALYAYAEESGNTALVEKANIPTSAVTRMRDAEVPAQITSFIATLRAELANLADYGITEDQVVELETSVDDFRPLVGQSRLVQSAGAIAARELGALVQAATTLLDQRLDKVILQFKLSDPGFYEGYNRARVIVDN